MDIYDIDVNVCARYCVPGSEREKLTSALKRIAPHAVELASPDWWLHSLFMVCIMSVDEPSSLSSSSFIRIKIKTCRTESLPFK